jgi:hypothetical protein
MGIEIYPLYAILYGIMFLVPPSLTTKITPPYASIPNLS